MPWEEITPENNLTSAQKLTEESIKNALQGKVEGLSREALADFISRLRLEMRDELFLVHERMLRKFNETDSEFKALFEKYIGDVSDASSIAAIMMKHQDEVSKMTSRAAEEYREYLQEVDGVIYSVLKRNGLNFNEQ